MSAGLELPLVQGDLTAALGAVREALADQLMLDFDRPFSFSVEDDDGNHGAPAWSDVSGQVCAARDTVEAIIAGDVDAIAAIAHQLVHTIGSGPAFFELEEQLLEEAVVEIIAQCYSASFCEAFGVDVAEPPLLFCAANGDLEVARPTAANVAVERFGRIAAWLESDDGDSDSEDLEEAALKWAIKLKSMPAADRFPVLAAAAADLGGDDEDGSAAEYLEQYLRGYMKQSKRSRTGFQGLEYALSRAWVDEAEKPGERLSENIEAWRAELEAVERVVLMPLPKRGAIEKALAALSPEVAAAARRSLDARALLWSARTLAASL